MLFFNINNHQISYFICNTINFYYRKENQDDKEVFKPLDHTMDEVMVINFDNKARNIFYYIFYLIKDF